MTTCIARSRALNMRSIWGLLVEQKLYITLQKAEALKLPNIDLAAASN